MVDAHAERIGPSVSGMQLELQQLYEVSAASTPTTMGSSDDDKASSSTLLVDFGVGDPYDPKVNTSLSELLPFDSMNLVLDQTETVEYDSCRGIPWIQCVSPLPGPCFLTDWS